MTLKELSTILQDDIPINVYIKSPHMGRMEKDFKRGKF